MDGPFFLFAGAQYESCGGMNEYQGGFATLAQAQAAFIGNRWYNWAQIVVVQDGQLVVVATGERENEASDVLFQRPDGVTSSSG